MPAIKGKHYRTFIVINIYLCILLFATSKCFAGYSEFQINCPYWEIRFDRAGYVDLTFWYDSVRHNSYNSEDHRHEMMTGDWAAAVWYQGIKQGSNQAQWLTNSFVAPGFETDTPFVMQSYNVSNSSCNPVWTDPYQPTNPYYNPTTK